MNTQATSILSCLGACLLIGLAAPTVRGGEEPGRSDDLRAEGLTLDIATTDPAGLALDLGSPVELSVSSSGALPAGLTTPRHIDWLRADTSSDYGTILLSAFQDAPPAAGAPEGHAPPHHGNLAEQATNPVAPLIQLQFQNQYNGENTAGSGGGNVFTIQPVIPWKIGEQALLTRITVPLAVATSDLGDPIGREYGIGDTNLLTFATTTIDEGGPWQGMIGPGIAFTFPTATSDFTGEGQWQAGPGFVYLNTATPGLQWGLFFYQQWSFDSPGNDDDRDNVSRFYFQPILTKHFDKGWYLALGDLLWSIDWNNNDRWSLPVGVRIGRVTKLGSQPVNLFLEPFYDVSGNNAGNEWGIKFNLTLLFPQG